MTSDEYLKTPKGQELMTYTKEALIDIIFQKIEQIGYITESQRQYIQIKEAESKHEHEFYLDHFRCLDVKCNLFDQLVKIKEQRDDREN